MKLTDILTLFDYDSWATTRTLQSVASLSEPKYLENLKSSHGGIHGTLVHIYSADWLWLCRWQGASPTAHLTSDEILNLQSLKIRWKDTTEELHRYLRSLTEEKLLASLAYSDLKGNRHSEPLFQQMQHRVNHSSYHRGQVVTMIRQQGGRPLGTDMITFFREKPTKPV